MNQHQKKRRQTSNPSEQQISKDCWQPKLVLPNFVDTSDITEHIGSDEEHMWSVEINVEFQEMCFHTRDGPPIPSTSLILDMVVRKLTDCEEGDEIGVYEIVSIVYFVLFIYIYQMIKVSNLHWNHTLYIYNYTCNRMQL